MNNPSFCKIFLIVFIGSIVGCNFKSDKCVIVERYDNEKIKIKVCEVTSTYHEGVEYDENGNLKREYFLKDFKLDGRKKEYFSSGKIKSIYHYKKGLLEGKCKTYHENGQLDFVGQYKNGLRNGNFFNYDKNGNLIIFNYCVDNISHYVRTYKSGQIVSEAFVPKLYFNNDTLDFTKQNFQYFYVDLPIPDSLKTNDNLQFAVGVKSIELKDSIFINPKEDRRIKLEKNKKTKVELSTDMEGQQIVYVYLMDDVNNRAYEPVEKEVTTIK